MNPSRPTSRRSVLLAGAAGVGMAVTGGACGRAVAAPGNSATGYDERYRPQFHYTPARNWMNDPNGPIYHRGEYHLFYQHNPHGTTWGDISWGHAVSTDLAGWQQLPPAIPADDEEMAFSGCVVVDRDNTSGFGSASNPAMVAVYTSARRADGRQAQALAYSTDRGRTWAKYARNPVLDIGSENFRDPKVFWHAPSHGWLMVVALSDRHELSFYRSRDLKHWTRRGGFGPANATGGLWECPDLFELPVDGDPARSTWVLVVSTNPGGPAGGSGTQYFTGSFDGRRFVPDDASAATRWVDHGADYYAPTTVAGTPDGRRIQVAWMNNWDYAEKIPTSPWRSADTVPRELSLRTVDGAPQLVQQPVDELKGLRDGAPARAGGVTATDGSTPLDVTGRTLEIEATLTPGDADRCGLDVRAGGDQRTRVGYDAESHEIYIDRARSGDVGFHPGFAAEHRAPLPPDGDTVRPRILVDRSSVEVFAAGGRVTLTEQVFPDPASRGVELFAEGGSATLDGLRAWRLRSSWR